MRRLASASTWLVPRATYGFPNRTLFPNLVLSRGVFQRHEVPVPTKDAVGTWVSNVYPFRSLAPVFDFTRWLLRRFGMDFTYHEDYIMADLKRVLESSGVSPCDYFPRFKEGGVVVYFRTLDEALKGIAYFNTHRFRGKQRHVFLIEGTPWLEDMLSLHPSNKVKVTNATFKQTLPMTEESLYNEMRVYGTLKALEMDPKQEFCFFTYRSQYSAISARICMHMKQVSSNTYLRVTYEPYSRFAWISKMLSNPRVTVPVIAIGSVILTFFLIDPVRLLNVVLTLMNGASSNEADELPDTPESEALAKTLANAPSGAGILLVGSPDARKLALDKVTNQRWFVVSINLMPEGQAKVGDTIQELCNQIGFFPTFNHLSRLFEYFQAMIPGTKAATTSGNVEEQLQAVLRVLTGALRVVSRTYPRDGRPFPYALVVLDFKSTMSEGGDKALVPLMQKWALEMMRMKLAHVIVTTDSHFTVTADSTTTGLLKQHAYVIHPVKDAARSTVRHLLEPLFINAADGEVPPQHPAYESAPPAVDAASPTEKQKAETDNAKGSDAAGGGVGKPKEAGVGGVVGGILSSLPIPSFPFGGKTKVDTEKKADPVSEIPPPPPPPPPFSPPASENVGVESVRAGLWQQAMMILERVVLRRSRDIYERYAGKEKAHSVIPMEGLTIDSLTELVYNRLGGRMPDVIRFVRRVDSSCSSPIEIMRLMEEEAQAEILNRAFGKKLFSPGTPGVWTQPHAWKCIKAVARSEGSEFNVPVSSILLSVFKGDKAALQSLVSTGVFRMVESGPSSDACITAGSPLFLYIFKTMIRDPTLRKGMEQMVLDADYADLTTEGAKLSEELAKLGESGHDLDVSANQGLFERRSQIARRLGELAVLINQNRQAKKEL